MLKPMEYNIVAGQSWGNSEGAMEELVVAVQYMMEDGWKPLGAASALVYPSQDGLLPVVVFFQTLVKDERREVDA